MAEGSAAPPNMPPREPMRPPSWDCMPSRRPSVLCSTLGKLRRRRVWPVGAVSKTTQVNSSASAWRMISAKVIASSMPGRESEISLTKPVRLAPKPPEPPAPSASAPCCMAC